MNAERAIKTLRGGLWHTTSPERFEGIQYYRAILVNPPIPEDEKWGTRSGPEGWPFVRKLGGVSLFDFEEFDIQTYKCKWPLSSWWEFVPFRQSWGAAVWIEIDRVKASDKKLMRGCELLRKWREDKAHQHQLMPCIEGCYLGDIPQHLFLRVLAIGKHDDDFRSITS